MKCNCDKCKGNGTLVCPECNGSGITEFRIETIVLDSSMNNYTELLNLQRDAKRCISESKRLCDLNPSRRDSYIEQLNGCLETINAQADKASKNKS